MFDQPGSSPKKITLAKVAAILAATAGISFGLCTAGAFIAVSSGKRVANIVSVSAAIFGILVVVSLLGLVVVGIVAIINSSRRPKDE